MLFRSALTTAYTPLLTVYGSNGVGGPSATLFSNEGGSTPIGIAQRSLSALQAASIGTTFAPGYGTGGMGVNFSFPAGAGQTGGYGLIFITEFY